jgi:hypothetical protein
MQSLLELFGFFIEVIKKRRRRHDQEFFLTLKLFVQ